MANIKKTVYKYCIVPQCNNTTKTTFQKVFFLVPRNAKIRMKWCKAAKRNEFRNKKLSATSCLYCCEDHFNLEEDTENFIQYQIMAKQQGIPVTLRLRKGILPHKFQCQKKYKPIPERKAVLKRQRLRLFQEALSAATIEVTAESKLCAGPADSTYTTIKMSVSKKSTDPQENEFKFSFKANEGQIECEEQLENDKHVDRFEESVKIEVKNEFNFDFKMEQDQFKCKEEFENIDKSMLQLRECIKTDVEDITQQKNENMLDINRFKIKSEEIDIKQEHIESDNEQEVHHKYLVDENTFKQPLFIVTEDNNYKVNYIHTDKFNHKCRFCEKYFL